MKVFTLVNYIDLNKEQLIKVLSWRNNEVVRKNSINKDIITLENHLQFVQKLEEDQSKSYWLVKKKKKDIGVVSLFKISQDHAQAFWGYYLNPEYIGSGLGVELEFYVLEYFFNEIKIKRLFAEVSPKNTENLRIQKIFTFRDSDDCKQNDNVVKLVLTKDEWEKLPKSYLEISRSS